MATIKANKDKARFISNTISQDALDGDWVDHEVVTKYKLPEIAIDASTSTVYPNNDGIVSPTKITIGDKLKVLDGASMVDRTAGTVITTGGAVLVDSVTLGGSLSLDATKLIVTKTAGDGTYANSNSYSDTAIFGDNIYSEVIVTTVANTAHGVGVCLVNTRQDDLLNTANANAWVYHGSGDIWHNGATLQTGLTATPQGSIVGIKYSYSTGVLQFYVGGVASGTAINVGSNTSVYLVSVMYSTGGVQTSVFTGTTYQPAGTTVFDDALYQAPITATTNIPTKAYFNKTIDTTLSAEDTDKCKSSTITQIGVL